MATTDTDPGLQEFADELREAVTDTLAADPPPESPSEELLTNGRAVALAIQELAARVELLTLELATTGRDVRSGLEELVQAVDRLEGP